MSALRLGAVVTVTDLPGRWSVWSQSDECPGGHYLIPADDDARDTGHGYVVVRVMRRRADPRPVITLWRGERAT